MIVIECFCDLSLSLSFVVIVVIIVALELPIDQTKVIGVETSPVAQTEGGENNNRLLMQLLDLLCGNLCKNTPLADLVPSPTDVPEVNSYHGRSLKTIFQDTLYL